MFSRSPEAANAIVIEERFNGNEHQVAGQCLGDEDPIEWIAEGTRQSPGSRGVFDGDWQFLEVLSGYCPSNVEGQHFRLREFTEPMFCGDLPGRRRADHDVVAVISNRLPCR